MPALVMLIPSVVACFLSTPYWEVSFVAAYNYHPYVSVKETFRILFGDSWQYLWPVVLVSALQIVSASLLTSAMDRHFRTGKLSLANPKQLLNNSIFPMFLAVLAMCVFSIVWRFVLFGLVLLAQTICGAAGFAEGATLAVIAVISVAMFFVHVMVITPMIFWPPIMFVYGYRFGDAAAASFKLLSGKRVFRKLFPPLLICALIQLLVGFLQAPMWAMCISSFFIALFDNVFVTVFTIVVFYRISDLDRRDVIKYEFSVPQSVVSPKPEKQERIASEAAETTAALSDEQAETVKKQKRPKKDKQKTDGSSGSADANAPAAAKPTAKKSKKSVGKPRKNPKRETVSDKAADAEEGGDVV